MEPKQRKQESLELSVWTKSYQSESQTYTNVWKNFVKIL